ncbi:MAG: DUF3168 domain-containing protein [Thalassovita sp.]
MSYAMTAALQQAIFDRLSTDVEVTALVDGVFDALPAGDKPTLYALIGDETAVDRSDVSGAGARHDFTVSILSDSSGFHSLKQAAAAVNDALLSAPLSLSRGAVVGLWFLKATTKRHTRDAERRIDLKFRVRVEET